MDRLADSQKYIIEGDTLTNMADAVRKKTNSTALLTPEQITAKINQIRLGIPVNVSNHINPETGEWERPSTWPNVDTITIPDGFDGVYLTYDLSLTPGYGWIGVSCDLGESGTYTVERGHLENGVFVSDYSQSLNSGALFREALDEQYGSVQLWRVSSTAHITKFGFVSSSATAANAIVNRLQPCVEAIGRLTYITNLSSAQSQNARCFGTQWMERDARACGGNGVCTTMANCWLNCYNLQVLDLSGWNTTNWAVTVLEGCWQGCYSLQVLDLSGWNTANWAITTLAYCWNACYSLQTLDVSGWDTTNWAVTTLANCWNGCYSLQSLDFSGWNTTNWAVTTLSSCWSGCYSLQILNLSGWNTTNWAVKSIQYCWLYCYSLQNLDLSGWNTTNWAVTTMSSCWNGCYSLRSLIGVSTWTFVSKIKSASSVFAPALPLLQEFSGIPYSISHSYADAKSLTPQSIVNILTVLPTVTSATITLGSDNKNKVRASDIAIATAKGWTVA